MKDLFAEKNMEPMLIAQMRDPFDHKDWIYELKLDGSRCLAYLDKGQVALRNKRGLELLPKFPELEGIWKGVGDRCILDGELVVLRDGLPDFYELQRRAMLADRFKIELGGKRFPASYVAYDCLYEGNQPIMDRPLMERKESLNRLVKETPHLAISRFIWEYGRKLYQLADERKLEGVVAKRQGSFYYPGKRTKDWVKFKRLADEDFLVCGYILKEGHGVSLVLGKWIQGSLAYKGHVTLGVSRALAAGLEESGECPFKEPPAGHEKAVWTVPTVVCTVEYMPNTRNALRQPVFKGIRDDVEAWEVAE